MIVGRGFTSNKLPPKRTIESFITAASERGCQHIESETAANEGGVIKTLGEAGVG